MVTSAGASDAFATVYFEQSAMGRALDEGTIEVEKMVWHPIEWNAQMGAAVPVGIQLIILADSK
tara:strand:- start:20215 stop:20406 length:192 start_codon:yes stop_codon:yes gene_type:complete